ncbi:MAG TPA: hypothetical protein VGG19_20855 [Tepidisphaeraceae bacterium]|jgi:hypothetical protein
MEPLQEILQTVREIRQAQIAARETQLKAVKTYRRLLALGGLFFLIIVASYIIWCYVVVTHVK